MHTVVQHNRLISTSVLALGLLFCTLVILASQTLAQNVASAPLLPASATKLSTSPTLTKNLAVQNTSSKPEWKDLTPEQQQSLKPLTANWNSLEEAHKRKWLAISLSYPSLSPAEQVKMHSRMTEWVSLSPQQRTQARLNFARSKQLTPTQKTATWEAYQALSPEEKQKLATSAPPKPGGAAAAAKPVPIYKLAVVPVTRKSPTKTPKLTTATDSINQYTLLPHSTPPAESAAALKN